MPPYETLLAFAAATLVFACFPGPAVLYTAAQTLARGRRAGFMAVFGIHVGCYAHVAGAAFGLSAMFAHVPAAYLALKLAGAAYLIWLGIGMMRAQGSEATEAVAVPVRSTRRAFADSVIVELLNPKVAIFFIAFLPQFVDPAASLPLWAQFLILGTFVNLVFSSGDVIVVLAASAVMARMRGSGGRAGRFVRWAAGGVMVGLGLKLATSKL